jgi:hypothetical protein
VSVSAKLMTGPVEIYREERAELSGGSAERWWRRYFVPFGADPRVECLPPHPPLRISGQMKGDGS